jgi:hypothetical protein
MQLETLFGRFSIVMQLEARDAVGKSLGNFLYIPLTDVPHLAPAAQGL